MDQKETVDNVLDVGRKTVTTVAETTLNISQAIIKYLMELRKSELLEKELNDGGEIALEKMKYAIEHNGEKLDHFIVGDESYDELIELMNSKNVTYAVGNPLSKDGKIVYFLEKDAEKVNDVLSIMSVRQGIINEIPPNLFVENLPEERIGILDNVTDVELELFRHYFDSDFAFSSMKMEDSDNTYSLLFDVKNRDAVYETLSKATWDLTDPFQGEKIKEHIEYKLYGRQQLNMSIRDAQKEFYVVSGKDPGTYIHVTEKDYTYYKNGHQLASKIRDDSAIDDLRSQISGLASPVMMTKEEFSLSQDEKAAILEKALDPFPRQYDEIINQNTRNSIKALILKGANDLDNMELQMKFNDRQRKIALDDEANTPAYIEDDSLTYSDFSVYEHIADIMDDEEEAARRREFDHYMKSNKVLAGHEYHDIQMEEHTVDYLVKEAENQREENRRENAERQSYRQSRGQNR